MFTLVIYFDFSLKPVLAFRSAGRKRTRDLRLISAEVVLSLSDCVYLGRAL